MRKLLVYILVILCFSHPSVSAQDAKKIWFGISMAPGIAGNYGKDTAPLTKPLFGTAGGIQVDFFVSPRFFFHSGFFYERKGYKVILEQIEVDGSLTGNYTTKFHTNYLVIPLTLSYLVKEETKIHMGTGIYLGKLLNARQDGVSPIDGTYYYEFVNRDISHRIEDWDFGISFLAGKIWDIRSTLALTLDLQYDIGLLTIDGKDQRSIKNYSLSLHLGLIL